MIRMEHPELPKTVDDPPVQLWRMRRDDDVRSLLSLSPSLSLSLPLSLSPSLSLSPPSLLTLSLCSQGNTFYQNVVTDSTQRDPPKLKRGGILADEMGKSTSGPASSPSSRTDPRTLPAGLGKTMQTVALICTDDTGEGVLAEPEEADYRYDDMTLIGASRSTCSSSAFRGRPTDASSPARSVPALGRVELDRAAQAARRQEAPELALLPRRGPRAHQEAVAPARRHHRDLVRSLSLTRCPILSLAASTLTRLERLQPDRRDRARGRQQLAEGLSRARGQARQDERGRRRRRRRRAAAGQEAEEAGRVGAALDQVAPGRPRRGSPHQEPQGQDDPRVHAAQSRVRPSFLLLLSSDCPDFSTSQAPLDPVGHAHRQRRRRPCVSLSLSLLPTCLLVTDVDSLYAVGTMLQFLHVCRPLDDADVWKQRVTRVDEEARGRALRVRPLSPGPPLHAQLTQPSCSQAVVLSTTLRR